MNAITTSLSLETYQKTLHLQKNQTLSAKDYDKNEESAFSFTQRDIFLN